MNIANKITVSRILVTVVFVILAAINTEMCRLAAWGCGLFAAVSDVVDGYLARKYELVTDFGKLMDPLADKIFMAAALVVLVENNIVPGWVVIIILSREFAVTGLRLIAAQKGKVIDAAIGGKIKTFVQFIYIAVGGVIWIMYGEKGLQALENEYLIHGMSGLMIATAVITVYTGYEYFIKNKKLYLESL
jgi:CDP-diacylglycerol---glycerol-3-phosphate 3-phosphatidyltransferase